MLIPFITFAVLCLVWWHSAPRINDLPPTNTEGRQNTGPALTSEGVPPPASSSATRSLADDNLPSPAGIDVSNWDRDIDWNVVAQSGVKFAYAKATEGDFFTDAWFAQNREGAHANGILFGAYHFFRPDVSARAQAEYFLQAVGEMRAGELPPALDLEDPADWQSVNPGLRVAMIKEWLDIVEQRLHVRPIIYLSPAFVNDVLGDATILGDYLLWVAHYTDDPQPWVPLPWSTWTFWQYSSHAEVAGIPEEREDVDHFNGTLGDLRRLART